MNAQIALYKGPASSLFYRSVDWSIRKWTSSKYSHVELVIDNISYSSSVRDKGVRAKAIAFNRDKWDIYPVYIDVDRALAWFKEHDKEPYDWLGVYRKVIPIIPHRSKKWFCFEAVAASLDLASPHSWTGRTFEQYVNFQNSWNKP